MATTGRTFLTCNLGEKPQAGRKNRRIAEFKREVRCLNWGDIMMDHRAAHLYQHFSMSDSDLIDRIVRGGVHGASTFDISREDLIERIKETLLDADPESIVEWLDDYSADDQFVVQKVYPDTIGRGFYRTKAHNWKNGALPCKELHIVLRKEDQGSDYTWKITTAYCRANLGR